MSVNNNFTIFVFTWNADGLRLCETLSRKEADNSRGYRKLVTGKIYPCTIPDFFIPIRDIIQSNDVDLIVIGTVEEPVRGTYFHSELMPHHLQSIGYYLLKHEKVEKIGDPSSKLPNKINDTGETSIRMSIYVKRKLLSILKVEEEYLEQLIGDKGQIALRCERDSPFKRISGAVAAYVWHPLYGRFVFICVELPSGVSILRMGNSPDYLSYRQLMRAGNQVCLINMLNRLVHDPRGHQPNHVMIFGDLNYNISIPNFYPAQSIRQISTNLSPTLFKELYITYDELYDDIQKIFNYFKEGVDGEGPMFMPTWKLAYDRPPECSPTPNQTQLPFARCFDASLLSEMPSWRDRIIYEEAEPSDYEINCLMYDRLDVGNMNKSTHAGVFGIFNMRSI